MTPRLEATHFIMQYDGKLIGYNFLTPLQLDSLQFFKNRFNVPNYHLRVVAIWKIKFK